MNKTALPSTCTDEKRLVPAPSAAAAESGRRSKVVWTVNSGELEVVLRRMTWSQLHTAGSLLLVFVLDYKLREDKDFGLSA